MTTLRSLMLLPIAVATAAACADGDPAATASAAVSPAPALTDPTQNGTYRVYRRTVTVRTAAGSVATTICAPSDDGSRVSPTGGPFPLLVIGPGFQQGRAQYASYCDHLATWGVIAIGRDNIGGFAPNHSTLANLTTGLVDWALGGTSGLAPHVDAGAIAVAGHSLGGKVGMLAASRDPRIGLVVGWDPVDSGTPSVAPELMGAIDAPVVVIGETLDGTGSIQACAPTAQNYQRYFDAAAPPALAVTVLGADHFDFVDNPGCFTCRFCRRGTADPAAVRALTRRTTVAAIKYYLEGDASADSYLTGAAMQADVAAGRVTIDER
jgi:pimeloyl-ACP methyl ester carboxylesterase